MMKDDQSINRPIFISIFVARALQCFTDWNIKKVTFGFETQIDTCKNKIFFATLQFAHVARVHIQV